MYKLQNLCLFIVQLHRLMPSSKGVKRLQLVQLPSVDQYTFVVQRVQSFVIMGTVSCKQEAIAGKCYVICTSEDRRNRQPSEEEIKLADYIFYRTFNVGQCTLSDKMDDCVGGLAGMCSTVSVNI